MKRKTERRVKNGVTMGKGTAEDKRSLQCWWRDSKKRCRGVNDGKKYKEGLRKDRRRAARRCLN